MTDCERLMGALGQGELPANLAVHAGSCERCRAAVAAYRSMAPAGPRPMPSRPLALSPALAGELSAAAGKKAPSPWRWPVLLGAVQAVVAVGTIAVLGRGVLVRNQASPAVLVVLGALLGLSGLGGTLAALAPGYRRARYALVGAAVALAGVLGISGSGLASQASFLKAGAVCASVEAACTVLPLALVLWFQRQFAFDPVRALAGSLAAAATGVFALHLHCAIGTADHLYTFHVAPWLLLGALGWWIRGRLSSRSFAP